MREKRGRTSFARLLYTRHISNIMSASRYLPGIENNYFPRGIASTGKKTKDAQGVGGGGEQERGGSISKYK